MINQVCAAVRWLRVAADRRVRAPLFHIGARSTMQVLGRGSLSVGKGTVVLHDCVVRAHGKVRLAPRVFVNRGAHIVIRSELTVGQDTLFGEYVSIHDDKYLLTPEAMTLPPARRGFESFPIRIGDEVWIGAKVTILGGVTIGDGAVVAANSVVSRDVEAFTVVAGAPARFVRRLA